MTVLEAGSPSCNFLEPEGKGVCVCVSVCLKGLRRRWILILNRKIIIENVRDRVLAGVVLSMRDSQEFFWFWCPAKDNV